MGKAVKGAVLRLGLVVGGVVFALLLAEGVVRLSGQGQKGSVGVLYQASELLGWEHKSRVSLEHESSEFSIVWHLNNEGLRRSEDVTPKPTRPRIVVLGDSHAAGHGVNEQEMFAARLETMLDTRGAGGVEVLNFGVDGYSTSQELLWTEDQLERWQPDGVVVAVYLGNDLRENLETGGLGEFERPVLDPAELTVKSTSPTDSVSRAGAVTSAGLVGSIKETLSDHSKLYALVGNRIRGGPLHRFLAGIGVMRPPIPDTVRRVLEHVQGAYGQFLWQLQGFDDQPQRQRRAIRLTARILKRIQSLCDEHDVRFLAVALPSRIEVQGIEPAVEEAAEWLGIEASLGDRARELRSEFETTLNEFGVSSLDLLEAARSYYRANPGVDLFYPRDWHLNPVGHQLVANEILTAIDEWAPEK